MEGEKMWRAAAQVRVLLRQSDTEPPLRIHSKAFWDDPDVRWLAGVNTASEITYFNKEQFEELLCWIQLPALFEIARDGTSKLDAISEVEAEVSRACRAAKDAGYKLDKYLKVMTGDEREPISVVVPETDVSLADATASLEPKR
jgi:hypothetical protein